MKSGRDATRRNRNIGTSKQGHGKNNEFVIPFHFYPSLEWYYELLEDYRSVQRSIGDRQITFLVERTLPGCLYSCSVDDIVHVLQSVPSADLEELELVILRQPKKKETILHPVWGRWVASAGISERYYGSAIFLEAVSPNLKYSWSKSMDIDSLKELDRLKGDGHKIEATKRHHVITMSLDAVRSTQLYRTLLHELGHHVDYNRNPTLFRTKPRSEGEVFAHRYADKLKEELLRKGVIPFDRILDVNSLDKDKLRMSDFLVEEIV